VCRYDVYDDDNPAARFFLLKKNESSWDPLTMGLLPNATTLTPLPQAYPWQVCSATGPSCTHFGASIANNDYFCRQPTLSCSQSVLYMLPVHTSHLNIYVNMSAICLCPVLLAGMMY
jgi:hypothetical protein